MDENDEIDVELLPSGDEVTDTVLRYFTNDTL